MVDTRRSARLWITVATLCGAFALLHTVSHGEPVVAHQPLRALPYSLGDWKGEERPFDERIVQAVSVSDYTNRLYSEPSAPPVQLYVGYYDSQRTGDTIHSPKNCLPGAGWDPIRSGYARISVSDGREILVNEYVIQQDQKVQMVFYWYQGRGRVTANEYAGKLWMVTDAILRNRTDGALVRLITSLNDGDEKARARLVRFTQVLFPYLDDLVPK